MCDNSQAIAIYIIIVAAWIWHYVSQETACLNALYTLFGQPKFYSDNENLIINGLGKAYYQAHW